MTTSAAIAMMPSYSFGMTEDRLDWHLWNFEQWMFRRVGTFRQLWYPSKASGGIGRSASSDFDAMVQHADARCARAVWAIVSELPRPQCIAVHVRHLAAVYQVRFDLDKEYASARSAIRRELMRRGID